MNWFLDFHQRLLTDPKRSFSIHLVLCLLIPFSLVYGFVNWLRLWCYRSGVFSTYRSSLPVVSVGNLSVGGTGKTPVVDWLAKQLKERGWRPAIVSRGYGGRFGGEVGLVSDGKELLMGPGVCGDEPFLLARRNPRIPVLIARKRVNAIKQVEQTGCADVILLDDAFQHHAVARHVDIVLLDATRPFGNGWPLPAGNLREFPRMLKRADILLRTRSDENKEDIGVSLPVFDSRHQLADHLTSLSGEEIQLDCLSMQRLVAFAGIANPGSFFDALSKRGMILQSTLSFADHEPYSEQRLAQIDHVARGADALLTTEKDAVKLKTEMFQIPCYAIAISLDVDDGEVFIQKIIAMIRSGK